VGKPRHNIIEVSSLDAERYYKITDKQLNEIIKLTPTKAGKYVRENCKFAMISSTDDFDLSFADNLDQSWSGAPSLKKEWIAEWDAFKTAVKDHLEG
jgi:hypothetical protein